MAALLHEVGKLMLVKEKGEAILNQIEDDDELLKQAHQTGISLLSSAYEMNEEVRAIVSEALRTIDGREDKDISKAANILYVAYAYDVLTAMHLNREPDSGVIAIRYLMNERNGFDKETVKALIDSIHILPAGSCVELSNMEKGVVLRENNDNILRPMVLGFWNNQVYDLYYDDVYQKIQIKDIMKTMDNRFVMDQKLVNGYMGLS
jgi:hypothetical protein